jgi:hypothetical protein
MVLLIFKLLCVSVMLVLMAHMLVMFEQDGNGQIGLFWVLRLMVLLFFLIIWSLLKQDVLSHLHHSLLIYSFPFQNEFKSFMFKSEIEFAISYFSVTGIFLRV